MLNCGYRVGWKKLVKTSQYESSYVMFDTYYDNPREAYDDVRECELEEIEFDSNYRKTGYYIIQDTYTRKVYDLVAFKIFVLGKKIR